MAECCIIGCDNKAEKRGGIKFYLLPTAKSSRPAKVKRRQLWLDAIEKANGTAEGLSRNDTQICSAHFISGQMSLDISDQDFVPSVFPKQHTAKSRRQTLRPRSGALAETPKVTPKKKSERKPANASQKSNNIFLPENNYCEPLEDDDILEEEVITQPPSCQVILEQQQTNVLKEEETTQPPSCQVILEQQQTNVLKEEETTQPPSCQVIIEQQQISVLKEEETTQPPSCQVIIEQQQINVLKEEETTQPPSTRVKIEQQQIFDFVNLKKTKLHIKPIVDRFRQFRCEVCNGKFATASGLLKHRQLHEQEWSDDDEILPTVSHFVVKSELIENNLTVEEPSLQCNMCDRSFPTIHSLKRHKLLHVRDGRKCTQCGTMFCKRHNHVIAQPQISTETNFEQTETTSNDMDETAECSKLCLSDGDGVDEGLELLLNSSSLTLDAIAAAQEQIEPLAENQPKEAPTITYNPRKPGLLIAFKSFLNKHRPESLKIKKKRHGILRLPTGKALLATATSTNTNAAGLITTITAPITPAAVPITTTTAPDAPMITTTAVSSITAPISTTTAAVSITGPITTTTAVSSITAPISTTTAAVSIAAPITTTTAVSSIIAPITTTTAVSSIIAPITTTTAVSSRTAPITTTTAVSSRTAPITTTTAVSSLTAPIPITTKTIAATSPIITASTMGVTAKPVPETSSKTYSLTTTSNALTPQLGKSVVYVARSQQQGPGQKMEQSTVCLSFSKPIPTNVIQEFMTYISKTEAMKSEAPQLVTFTAKQDQIIAKQETNKIASTLKLKPTHTPLQDVPEEPDNEKTTFIITTLSKSNVKPPPVILPKVNSQTISEILNSQNQKVEFRKPTVTAKKVKASPKVQVPYKRPYVHGSRPPTPEPIFAKIKKGPWDSPIPNYPKDFIQPHLPQTPKLPPELQMFSPQFLTSAMLDVERNFEYILSE